LDQFCGGRDNWVADGVDRAAWVSRRARDLRIACSGLVEERAGSVATAGYLVLRELVAAGVDVHFYANQAYVPEPSSLPDGRFEYLGFKEPAWIRAMPARIKFVANWAAAPVMRVTWARLFGRVARQRDSRAPYDAVLSLGTPPFFTIPGVPTISWLQGPPSTEIDAIERLRSLIIGLQGRPYYYGLQTFYAPRRLFDRHLLSSSNVLICGSQWSRERLLPHLRGDQRIVVLPYPIDLEHFRPSDECRVDWERPEIVWLGRLVPRKRLDLLLEAFPLVLQHFSGARLRIVGSPSYARKQLSLIESSPYRDRIEYLPWLDRADVARILQGAAVLVQTSENENFGSSVAEAQACGVPVVVGPANGTQDYIDPSSVTFRAYTPQAVGAALLSVLRWRHRAADEARRSARESAERWFTPSKVVGDLVAILADARRAFLSEDRHR
jgi:glycosyltransferase involved in cell wall biosynthesis